MGLIKKEGRSYNPILVVSDGTEVKPKIYNDSKLVSYIRLKSLDTEFVDDMIRELREAKATDSTPFVVITEYDDGAEISACTYQDEVSLVRALRSFLFSDEGCWYITDIFERGEPVEIDITVRR